MNDEIVLQCCNLKIAAAPIHAKNPYPKARGTVSRLPRLQECRTPPQRTLGRRLIF